MILIKQKSDHIGAIASTLCLIHCIATPFIFIAQSCLITYCDSKLYWWKFIDYFFLIVSFFAVYHSTQTAAKKWIKSSLWISWVLLFFTIVNEKMEWFPLEEYFIYIPALALIFLHLYNKKHCQCNTTKCSING